MHWIHRSTSLVAGTVLLVIAWSGSDHLGFDPAPYLSDLQALEDSTARSYANLEWQVQQGVVDPVALHRRTDSLIRAASSASDAQAALIAFGSAMKDGHYRLRRPQTSAMKWMMTRISGERESAPFVAMGGAKGCASLGYRDLRTSSPLRSHSAYHAVGRPDASFPTGFVDYNGQRVGVLRIASFGNDGYRTVCARAWPVASRADSSGVCAARCQRLLEDATSDSLLAELRHAIARLTSLGVTTLLVDLTGNGGGTNWVTPAARQFTARRLNGHVAGEIRHPHTERRLVTAVSALRTALANSADSSWRESLALAVARANAQLAAVRAPCDRRAIWREGLASIRCSQLATHRIPRDFWSTFLRARTGCPALASRSGRRAITTTRARGVVRWFCSSIGTRRPPARTLWWRSRIRAPRVSLVSVPTVRVAAIPTVVLALCWRIANCW